MHVAIIVLGTIFALLLILEALSLIIYRRFFFTSFVAFYIKHFRYSPFRQSYEECKRLISIPHIEYELPKKIKFCCSVSKKKENGMNVYYLNENTKSNSVFIYFHGGAFYNNFDKHQWGMINKIIKKTDALVIAPDYPLIPEIRCDGLYPKLLEFYGKIREKYSNKRIIIGGDSAGGTISMVLGELLNKEEQPDEIICLSPAVDFEIPPEDEESFRRCIFEDKRAWPAIAEMWLGKGMDNSDPLMSPINGDLSKIKHMTIFFGDQEFCYNSIFRLKAKNENLSNKIDYKLYKGMFHVWVATPVLEAKKAIKEICKIINKEQR
jgi:acetyl esterase/lipase